MTCRAKNQNPYKSCRGYVSLQSKIHVMMWFCSFIFAFCTKAAGFSSASLYSCQFQADGAINGRGRRRSLSLDNWERRRRNVEAAILPHSVFQRKNVEWELRAKKKKKVTKRFVNVCLEKLKGAVIGFLLYFIFLGGGDLNLGSILE